LAAAGPPPPPLRRCCLTTAAARPLYAQNTPLIDSQVPGGSGGSSYDSDAPPAPPQPPPPPLDLAPLGGVRGVAAATVVVGHTLLYFVPDLGGGGGADRPAWPAFGLEFLSPVTLFVVLSGFTLAAVYGPHAEAAAAGAAAAAISAVAVDATGAGAPAAPPAGPPPARGAAPPLGSWAGARAFFLKRAARLAPLYAAGLALGAAPFFIYTPREAIPLNVAVALAGQQSVVLTATAWDRPLWTVSALAYCYAAFPLLLPRLAACSPCGLARALWLACAASMAAPSALLAAFGLLAWPMHFLFILRLPQFVVGMAAALLAARAPLRHPAAVADGCSLLLAANIAACGGLTTVVRASAGETAGGYVWLLWSHWAEFLLAPVHALWIAALASPGGGGATRAVLGSRPARALGAISYALYCTHFPLLSWAAWAAKGRGVSADAVPLRAAAFVDGWFCFPPAAIGPLLAACAAIAAAAYWALERPARRAIVSRVCVPVR